MESTKHEIRNTKQIQMTKIQNSKRFGHFTQQRWVPMNTRRWRVEFRYCFGFRYSDFGFIQSYGVKKKKQTIQVASETFTRLAGA